MMLCTVVVYNFGQQQTVFSYYREYKPVFILTSRSGAIRAGAARLV